MKDRVAKALERTGLDKAIRSKLARGSLGVLSLKISWKVLGFAAQVILARLLGVEGFGAFALAFTTVSFITIFSATSTRGLQIQRIAAYRGIQNWSLARGFIRRMQQIALGLALVLAAGAGVFLWIVKGTEATLFQQTMAVALFLVPLFTLVAIKSATLHGLGHVTLCQVPRWIIRPIIFLFFLAILWLLPGVQLSAPIAMAAQVAAVFLTVLVSIWFVRRYTPSEIRTATPSFETPAWVRGALPFVAMGILMKVNEHASILLLGGLAGTEAVGIYRPASSIAILIMFGVDAVIMALSPTLAQRHAQGRTGGFQRLGAFGACAGFTIALVGALVVVFLGDWILLLFGRDFTAGTTALVILCIGRVLHAAMGIPGTFLNMTGNQAIALRAVVCAAVANIVLNVVLIPEFGANGAALATATSLLVARVYELVAVRRILGIDTSVFGLLRLRAAQTA